MTIYLLPFSYGWATRSKTALDKLSFFALWVIPVWFVCGMPVSWAFAVAIVVEYALYEIGYLFNDFYTVKKERTPHHRLSRQEREKVENRFTQIAAVRVTLIVMALLYLDSPTFVLALAFVGAAFALHNTVRSRWNIGTYALLCFSKYLALPVLFVPEHLGQAILALALSFVIPRTIEHAAKRKYRVAFLHSLEPHRFRAVYSGLLTIAAAIFSPASLLFFIALWYYAYRACTLALVGLCGDPRKLSKKPSPQL